MLFCTAHVTMWTRVQNWARFQIVLCPVQKDTRYKLLPSKKISNNSRITHFTQLFYVAYCD